MIEAMYGVEFVSNEKSGGFGVLILETGRIFGGDSSFVYTGSYRVESGRVYATIHVVNDRMVLESIFEGKNEFDLTLEGVLEHDQFVMKGTMKEYPDREIIAQLTRRAELP